MSWAPLNLSTVCTPQATISACQSSTYLFLQFLVSFLGRSRESAHAKSRQVFSPQNAVPRNYGPRSRPSAKRKSEYDFIIVGAGTAGCTLANRLSQVNNWKILLIEAGDEEPEVVDIPSVVLMTQRSSIDWNFHTQPQSKSCKARPDRRCHWPRGKVVGGSSSINYMIYLRGGPKDFDEWERLGNPGWGYDDVLPYFKKSEQNNNIEKVDKRFHGTDGESSIEFFPHQDQNVYSLLEGYRELGLDVFDQNTDRQLGASLMQHYTRDGQRYSANAAFLRPIRGVRKNLVVLTKAFVTKLLINQQSKTIYGVQYFRNGKYYKAFAKKEVIVSAGTISTPKLLMVSGIGPAKHLHDMNIKIVSDVAVGQNLHDHTTTDGPLISITNKTSTIVTGQQQILDVHKFKQLRRGPLAGTATIQVNAFIQSRFERDEDRPDMQFTVDPMIVQDYLSDPALMAMANIRSLAYYNGFMIRPILLAPKSRGYILLNDTDPVFGDPLIYPNTFHNEEDLDRMVDGIQQILHILDTPSFRRLKATLITTPVPGCENFDFGTNDYWRCVFSSYTGTLYHPVGTCKMGSTFDSSSVVDSQSLLVHGVKRLRVIDASVMPVVTRANTNAATMMIAEKGADFVKRDWIEGYQGNLPKISSEETKSFTHFTDFFDDFL